MTDYSDAALIERYLELRDWIARETDKHDERMKPYVDGMEAIEAEFMTRFATREPDLRERANSATQFGTAFRVVRLTPKVVDQSAFMDFVFKNWNDGGKDMFSITPLVGSEAKPTPLREWLQENVDPTTKEQKFPPGLEVTRKVTVNIRKV